MTSLSLMVSEKLRYNPRTMSQIVRSRMALGAAGIVFLALWSTPAAAGDAFLRGGVIFSPRDIGFEGRWRISFGSDYPVNFGETIFVGFELQTSVFRQDVADTPRTATLFPANGFVNVKYKSGNVGTRVRPYGGGGLGLIGTFILLSGANNWESDFGYHLVGGVELGRLSVELQLQRPFSSDAAMVNQFGSNMSYALYAGFVW
ncbi:MAG: hypothetical protein BMS9Abin37_0998 [Acidobacteriota bacterium]|nr:MAG: hypothetical protein BMS9Abin37_0998 [Acidobacteriota bacterium]